MFSKGSKTILSVVLVVVMTWAPLASASEPFIGQIMMVGFNFPPRGWAFCDGQLLSITSNTALFSLLGTTYGGDGRTIFGLPDLRGRVAIHPGTGAGLRTYRWGERGGVENVTLTVNQMPQHDHVALAFSGRGDEQSPDGHVWAMKPRDDDYSSKAPNVQMSAQAINYAGGNQSHPNIQPYLGIYHCIALVGIYPSRN